MVTLSCNDVTFRNIKAIVFDKDGTLENSGAELRELAIKCARLIDAQVPGIGDPLLMAFGVLDQELDSQGLMAVGSRAENQIAAAAYIAETGRSWPESLKIAESAFNQADEYIARNKITSTLFTGVETALQRLQGAGLTLALLSADSDEGVQRFVKQHELEPIFTVALGLTDDGLNKPNPALLQKVCDRLELTSQEIVMVGDSGFDWRMAKQAKAGGVIGIHWGDASRVPAQEVDVAIADLEAITVI